MHAAINAHIQEAVNQGQAHAESCHICRDLRVGFTPGIDADRSHSRAELQTAQVQLYSKLVNARERGHEITTGYGETPCSTDEVAFTQLQNLMVHK